jgi:hypothetical protein
MKSLDLNALSVVEMSEQEIVSTEGGYREPEPGEWYFGQPITIRRTTIEMIPDIQILCF